jgi:benzoylformate decarboxylase
MTHTTGRSAFLSLLKDEGITHLFGNPGTTELPVMHALMDHPELTYVMAMPESLVVAMADGFSRASGKLVACNVHVAPGLGNAMGSLYNAGFTGKMAELLVKWAVEVTRLEDLPRIVRRAAKIATTPPTGPVFISLAGDILNAEADIELGRSTRVDTRVTPSREALDALVDRIYPRDVRSWWSATRSSRATRSTKRPFSPRGSAVRLISRLSPMARISSPTIHASWVRCRATNSKRAKFLRLTIS